MGCAKPVIATAVGGIPEIIENGVNGILVPPFDSKLLSYYIEHLLHDKEKCSLLSRNAYKDVKQRYDWKIIANLYLNFILNILIK
jgi:glycosyltransferase involved in cell wall biosynthesis